MGWNNPPMRWEELNRALIGDPPGDGNDSPAWSRKREGYLRPGELGLHGTDDAGTGTRVPYAELHCHSNFSFLDGASHLEERVEEAARLGLDAIALTDHDGMYGVVRFAEAARELGVRTVYGTELSFGLSQPQKGIADPECEHLLLLARKTDGYASLCRAITAGQLRGPDVELPKDQRAEKGRPVYRLEEVAEEVRGQCAVLTGCRKGAVRKVLLTQGAHAAAMRLQELVDLFGAGNVYVELIDHGQPFDSTHSDILYAMAQEFHLPTVATTAAHYARPERWLPASGMAFLRSGEEMEDIFGKRYPGSVRRAALLGTECAFDLKLVAPKLPPFDVPEWHSEATFLRELTYIGALKKFGPRAEQPEAYEQLDHELRIIEDLGFPGYFLIVHDIVDFCRRSNILCQGRGSAANSAVCYALVITNVDAVKEGLLFERFLAPDRDGYPDIDVDIESDRREEGIQYVFEKHGRLRTAQVANVITYRSRSAVRDAARAFGFPTGQQDVWSKQIDRWVSFREKEKDHDHDIPDEVVALANALEDFPRHLGIHSGGMVICDRPVSEVCPIEWARMENRSVLQ